MGNGGYYRGYGEIDTGESRRVRRSSGLSKQSGHRSTVSGTKPFRSGSDAQRSPEQRNFDCSLHPNNAGFTRTGHDRRYRSALHSPQLEFTRLMHDGVIFVVTKCRGVLMTRNSVKQQQALRRSRERRRANDAHESPSEPSSPSVVGEAGRHRLSATTCGWCDGPIDLKSRGRIPKWCSAACRQRAWEQSRAAASGRAAVQIVERRIEIRVPQPAATPTPRHRERTEVLRELADQLDRGAIYDRDLPELTAALNDVLTAFERRPAVAQRHRTGHSW